ncbi:hypothetical protein CDG77_23690 [Nostoc sp. 'Peltigera membranacea cyanobiont' 213]|nr:hypothetical protein CDG77_23690 [Nostoc sp. 'Peltigera membranacea cyanobiont' 213]
MVRQSGLLPKGEASAFAERLAEKGVPPMRNCRASLLPRGDAKSERASGVAYLRHAVLAVMNYLRVVFSILLFMESSQ